jgi:hypothetical protein
MAIAELPPRQAVPPSRSVLDAETESKRVIRRGPTLEQLVYIGLFAIALLIRLVWLGEGALHHDETHHANYSWRLFSGLGFVHDPLLHGPFLYHIGALFFFLFGDNNATARLGPALFGSVLVILPFFIRRELGRGPALLASVYLLFSPTYLYWSRHIRHDMYQVTFELLAFVALVRYASTRRPLWLYVGAAALGCMFSNMETFFLYIAMFVPLVLIIFMWRVWRPGILVTALLALVIVAAVFKLPGKAEGEGGTVQRVNGSYVCPTVGNMFPPPNPIIGEPGPIFGFEPLPTADNNYALCVRVQPDDQFLVYLAKLWQFFGHPSILLGAAITIIGLVALYVAIWVRRDANGMTVWQRARTKPDQALEVFASLSWGSRTWIALAIFFSIYGMLFSSFLVHPTGLISGTTGSLLYWLAQHGVARGGQPGYYYFIIAGLYEPLVLIWGAVGLVMVGWMLGRHALDWWARRKQGDGDAEPIPLRWEFVLPLLLVWWSVGTFGLYSWAGEKMPWLITHVALPMVLLGSWALARVLNWWRSVALGGLSTQYTEEEAEQARSWRGQASALGVYLAFFFTVMLSCYQSLALLTKPTNTEFWQLPLVLLVACVFVLLITAGAVAIRGLRWGAGALVIAMTLLIGFYTLQSSYRLSYLWPDDARERMIFVQTSTDVARVMERLEQASIRRGGDMDLPIWYDNETIWAWYLRRFTNKQQAAQNMTTPPGPEIQAVLMLQENLSVNAATNLNAFRIQRFPLRWWFPGEGTRLPDDWLTRPMPEDGPPDNWPLLMRLLRAPFDGKSQAELWRYLLYRIPPEPLASVDFVIAVRPELADEMGWGFGGDDQ